MNPQIAIVGMACRYPDANSPDELWQNVLAKRQAFRQMPAERLRAEDYVSPDRSAPDRTYSMSAAVINGYEFDRVGFRVAGSTFRSADMAHWLALDVASQALTDAGFPEGNGLPRESTGVLIGNTLTGEFSRANVMRLRWPYVQRVVDASLVEEGWTAQHRAVFLQRLEGLYKTPFAGVNEETLAGGLSNTIAGRICNHFDFNGGGYTVDGACASSLLAATTGLSALTCGDLDVAIIGGVDLSLDPFELVGFAKAGALAADEMRVYDARSAGFWPGEGCGFVVLMRYEDAVAHGCRIYGKVLGWGVSSDGSGGITRPEVGGQLLALQRAYRRAGVGIETVAYFEGHGTGTNVGDATELKALKSALSQAATDEVVPPVIGTVKANIGHTKAAAGVAGFIKATMALYTQTLPPTTACQTPHAELNDDPVRLRVLGQGECWPRQRELRAAVSAMGFGGINTHILIEGVAAQRRHTLDAGEQALVSSAQDAELFLLGGEDAAHLLGQVEQIACFAAKLSRSEITDLACCLEKKIQGRDVRVAIVASTPLELSRNLETLKTWFAEGVRARVDVAAGIFLGSGTDVPRIGFLFPGQGSPAHLYGGAWRRRFTYLRDLYPLETRPKNIDTTATEIAQPAIVKNAIAALRLMDRLEIRADAAIGHSLGELCALHWSGSFDEASLIRLATARGKTMGELGNSTGTMASIAANQSSVEGLLNGERVVIAGMNSPRQTVISGAAAEVAAVVKRAHALGLEATQLAVSHAFHSPLVAAAASPLAEYLSKENFAPLQRTVASTVTGQLLEPDANIRTLLFNQMTMPVRFIEAMTTTTGRVDLFIEVGPGRVLSGLAKEQVNTPVLTLDAGGSSLQGLLKTAGAAFALGVEINHRALFSQRFARPFDLDWQPRFFVNPCETAPVATTASEAFELGAHDAVVEDAGTQAAAFSGVLREAHESSTTNMLDMVKQLVAERAELPVSAIQAESSLLDDLHLNSIVVGQLVAEAAKFYGLPRPSAPQDYATATVGEIARALETLRETGGEAYSDETNQHPPGVDSWLRAFTVELVDRPAAKSRQVRSENGAWQVFAPPQNYALAEPLRRAFEQLDGDGDGCVVCLPPEPDESVVELLLEAARAFLRAPQPAMFVLVQHGGGAASFVRTLHLEMPEVNTCVVDVPVDHPDAVAWVVAEARSARGHVEAHYDAQGHRREPVLRLATPAAQATEIPLTSSDVLLVTGGGKGIAAECAALLARETGVRLALMGRAEPETDALLSTNLERMTAAGIEFRYFAADVTDAEAVGCAVRAIEASFGTVTAVLYGAGRNEPQLLRSHILDAQGFYETLHTKVRGAQNVLAAVDQTKLRLFIAFGSIIARAGMRGEADYALSNEWLTRLVEKLQQEHPLCRCLSVEWSVWSGAGMGERLGRVDALMREGITPITLDEGIGFMRRLLAEPPATTSVIVSGRFGDAPTLRMERTDLPLHRFLERPLVHYPGVELVVEAELSADTDPYLNDHVFHGSVLFPAVMGLEALAQVAMALIGQSTPPVFEDIRFARPVTVADHGRTVIRLAALVRSPGVVEVALRSEETGFQIDHFRAICRFDEVSTVSAAHASSVVESQSYVPIEPDHDLYNGLLFQGKRFQRLKAYRQLSARGCVAEIVPDGEIKWFWQYLPAELVLGDPAARDATIHAIQSCVPHATILPIGVERLEPCVSKVPGPWLVSARERSHEGGSFVYDVEVMTVDGVILERWVGMKLQVVETGMTGDEWVGPLLGPYIERRLHDFHAGSSISVAVDRNGSAERRVQSDRAIQRALGEVATIRRRLDGKPEVADGRAVSSTHAGDLTMAIAGLGLLACDLEAVETRSSTAWQHLLGRERCALVDLIAQELHEDGDAAATRVWSANECLKKAGARADAPLVLVSTEKDGWVKLASGQLVINTLITRVRKFESRLSVAVLADGSETRV